MDTQPKEQRIEQVKMWIKHKKEAIKALSKSNQNIREFYEHHAMVIHKLADTVIHPLGEIINTLENELESYEQELVELGGHTI